MHQVSGFTSGSPQIRYWATGNVGSATAAPRVLMIMGFGMRGELWRPQIEGLMGQHQVAWFDNRGIGESAPGARRVWTIKDMARDALRVMDALGWEDCHLVGVSMGGMVAQECALLAESRFRSLSLIATHEGGRWGWVPTRLGLQRFLRANFSPETERFSALEQLLYPAEWLATANRESLRARMEAQVGKRAARSTLMAQLYAVLNHDTGARLGSLSLPTLVIKPARDILVPPSHSDRLRRRIPHARLLELADAGHGAVFQSKDEINLALAEHFDQADVDAVAAREHTIHA